MVYIHVPFSPFETFVEFFVAGVICYTFYKILTMLVSQVAPTKDAKLLSFKKVKFNGEKFELK